MVATSQKMGHKRMFFGACLEPGFDEWAIQLKYVLNHTIGTCAIWEVVLVFMHGQGRCELPQAGGREKIVCKKAAFDNVVMLVLTPEFEFHLIKTRFPIPFQCTPYKNAAPIFVCEVKEISHQRVR